MLFGYCEIRQGGIVREAPFCFSSSLYLFACYGSRSFATSSQLLLAVHLWIYILAGVGCRLSVHPYQILRQRALELILAIFWQSSCIILLVFGLLFCLCQFIWIHLGKLVCPVETIARPSIFFKLLGIYLLFSRCLSRFFSLYYIALPL